MGLWPETRKHFPMERATRHVQGKTLECPPQAVRSLGRICKGPNLKEREEQVPSGDPRIASWCPQGEVKQGVRGSALGDPANLVFQTGCHLGAQHSHAQLQPATSTLTQQASLGVFQDTGCKGLQQSPRTHQNRRGGRAGQESCWLGVEPQAGREARTRGQGATGLAVRPSFSTKLLCNLGQVTARL